MWYEIIYRKIGREDDNWDGGTYMVGRESDWVEKQFDCTYVNQLQIAINLCQLNK